MKDPRTKTKGWGRTECGRWWAGRAAESHGGKMGITVIEQQSKNNFKKEIYSGPDWCG